MLPRTDFSASLFCGGRRSRRVRSAEDMAETSLSGWDTRSSVRVGRVKEANGPGERLPAPAGGGKSLLVLCLEDDHLHLGLDVVAEVQLDGVQAELLDVDVHADHLGIDRQVLGPHR